MPEKATLFGLKVMFLTQKRVVQEKVNYLTSTNLPIPLDASF
jgi:hypothetical protein